MSVSFEIKNITVSSNGTRIVQNVSMTLKPGTITALMGPNGSGKSTLANAIAGHPAYDIAKGSVYLDGKDITSLPTEERARRGLFLSMQHVPEIPGVTLASFLHKAYASTWEDVPVLTFYRQLETQAKNLGIDQSFLTRHVNAGLSGGEKKLSEILQLAALKPRFAILDEIDSGVDVDSLRKVFAAVRNLRDTDGTAFLLITHYNAILDHITPDFVHIMKSGSIVRSGGPELVSKIIRDGFDAATNTS